MRQALFSLITMFAAAILVMVGGIRMARQDVQKRINLDRNRIFEFDAKLRRELGRLSDLYRTHLEGSSEHMLAATSAFRRGRLPEVTGLLEAHLFERSGKTETIKAANSYIRLPELVIDGRKEPLNPDFAVILDPSLLKELPPDPWLETPAPGIELYLTRPKADILVASFVDLQQVQQAIDGHLAAWLNAPLGPLDESKQRSRIVSPTGKVLATTGPEKHGPAALSMPIQTSLGTWRIDGWDGIVVQTRHDARVLTITGVLSSLLILSGLFIYRQQRRTIKLASERVSFVNRVSHELGTPLTNIALNLDLARDHLPDPPPAARQRLDHVNEEIQRLSRLVANVLTFSKREHETIEMHPQACVPDKVIADTLDGFRPALARREIEVELELRANRPAWLDPDALAQITGNLISNVEKYATSGKWIRIQTRMDEGQLKLEVQDRGAGIPEASKKRVFSAFERVHRGTNEGSSGTGLGLTIARELATRMGGNLELLDDSGGCTMRLCVPAPDPTKSEKPQKS